MAKNSKLGMVRYKFVLYPIPILQLGVTVIKPIPSFSSCISWADVVEAIVSLFTACQAKSSEHLGLGIRSNGLSLILKLGPISD